jgi:hypothetical protein
MLIVTIGVYIRRQPFVIKFLPQEERKSDTAVSFNRGRKAFFLLPKVNL